MLSAFSDGVAPIGLLGDGQHLGAAVVHERERSPVAPPHISGLEVDEMGEDGLRRQTGIRENHDAEGSRLTYGPVLAATARSITASRSSEIVGNFPLISSATVSPSGRLITIAWVDSMVPV